MAEEGSAADVNKSPGRRYGPAPSAVRAFCCALLLLIVLAGIIALVLYLVYRPSKPRFTVVGAAVYELNATSPAAVYELNATSPAAATAVSAVSAGMQFTLAVRNPNGRSDVFYDRLAAYVVYRGQAITPTSPLPPLYQEKDSTVIVSTVLGGGAVPVSEDVAAGLAADRAYGLVPARLVVLGKIKYRPGPFRTPWYGLYVKCDVLLGVKKVRYGQVPLLGAADCSVDT